jgi:hypothetical protein
LAYHAGGRGPDGSHPEGARTRQHVTRRQFLRATAAGLPVGVTAGAYGLSGCAPAIKGDFMSKAQRRVVEIGGAWGGATAARYVRLMDPSIEVVLLEPERRFVSCRFSNLVPSGVRTIDGKGDPAKLIPSLAGQPPAYLREQMLLFRQDTPSPRDATPKATKTLMRTIPDERIDDLAAYYSSLQ